ARSRATRRFVTCGCANRPTTRLRSSSGRRASDRCPPAASTSTRTSNTRTSRPRPHTPSGCSRSARLLDVSDERERHLIRYAAGFAPFVVARAEGAWVETTDGRRILDFTSGQICSTIGHNHARISAAIRRSLDEVVHLNSWMLSEPVLTLAERLAALVPAPLERSILLNTGSEANEVALKLAKLHTGRFEVVGLTRSFHGLLTGIASVNFSMAHAGYGPLLPGS